MEFNDSTFDEIVDSEKNMFIFGADCYGDFFINAREFNGLLNNFIKSVDDHNKYIAIAFISQVKKHHTLALMSAVRRHHNQTLMNLRFVIETAQWAAFAMCFTEGEKFFNKDKRGVPCVTEKHRKFLYNWLDANFPKKVKETRKIKELISGSGAHSNIINVINNIQITSQNDITFNMPFFDIEKVDYVKNDLWLVGNVALGVLDLFYGANKEYKVLQFIDEFEVHFKKCRDKNIELKELLLNSETYR